MTLEEAMEKVVEVIPSEKMTEFDEVLETIRKSTVPETSENWEEKYRELETLYKKRFVESLSEIKEQEKQDDVETETESVEIRDLDFSAVTE